MSQKSSLVQTPKSVSQALTASMSLAPEGRNVEAEARLRSEQARLDGLLKNLDNRLLRDFPRYAEIARRHPVSLWEVQQLLRFDEAPVSFVVSENWTFIHFVRADDAAMFKVDIDYGQLRQAVTWLRAALSPEGLFGAKCLLDCGYGDAKSIWYLLEILQASGVSSLAYLASYHSSRRCASKSSASGATNRRTARVAQGFLRVSQSSMACAPLCHDHPAFVSIIAKTKASKATSPFIGSGDPALEVKSGLQRGIEISHLFKGELSNVRAVRQLAQLPDTAEELRLIAETLCAGENAMVLGSEMTESRALQTDLSDSRVLAFATHSLVAGDIEGAQEPALVFTPPQEASLKDDGLLTSSEIADCLSLDADLVILSGYNTVAAGGTPGAEALSGLAKAFFYAGSRALLVSHWPVSSQTAVLLTTRMSKEAAKPKVGIAETLRRSMIALIDNSNCPYLAHPLFWAPFVIVGEGTSSVSTEPTLR